MTDFRFILQQELLERSRKNPRYSLRAYAKSLGISPATLSHFITGKRPITVAAIRKLAPVLNLKPSETQKFLDTAKEAKGPKRVPTRLLDFTPIDLAVFETISEWYHDAILELTHLKSFRPETKWIAKVLDLTVSQVNIAVDHLKKAGLLEITETGEWLDRSGENNTTIIDDELTSQALRRYQRSVLENSLKALQEVPKSQRDHTSMTFTVRSSDMPKIKERIKNFRRSLAKEMAASSESHDQVYQASFSIFPVSKITKGVRHEK